MADKLTLYNNALGHLKERQLASLSENREPRRVLDLHWNDAVGYCLEQGFWKFASRSIEAPASSLVTPAFGFTRAVTIPEDWIRTVVVSESETLDPPLLQYMEEAGYWYSNVATLFVKYISSDPTYGWNLGLWPETFTEYVAIRLAAKACKRITNDRELFKDLKSEERQYRIDARSKDAMNDPPGFPPVSFWVRARRGAFGPGSLWMGSSGSSDW